MTMPNPVLEQQFDEDYRVAEWSPGTTQRFMTAAGVARASAWLLVILLLAAMWGWTVAKEGEPLGWILPTVLGSIAVIIVGSSRPRSAVVVGPIYAALEGAVVGAVSRVYETTYGDGIVANSLLATFVVVGVTTVLFGTRAIRVTERSRFLTVTATLAVFGFYGVSLMMSIVGVDIGPIWDAGWGGILFSLAVVVLAAFNLVLDFDLIERGVEGRAPAWMNWYAAFGLLVTIVWLYLELLRLIAKGRSR